MKVKIRQTKKHKTSNYAIKKLVNQSHVYLKSIINHAHTKEIRVQISCQNNNNNNNNNNNK